MKRHGSDPQLAKATRRGLRLDAPPTRVHGSRRPVDPRVRHRLLREIERLGDLADLYGDVEPLDDQS